MTQPETPLDVWARTPFSDATEMIAAMQDPRYKSYIYPNKYREAVEAKIGISEGIGVDQTRSLGVEQSIGIGTGTMTGGTPAEDQKAIAREFAASRPDAPLAVNPNTI